LNAKIQKENVFFFFFWGGGGCAGNVASKFEFYEILELSGKYFMFFPFLEHQCLVESLVIRQISGVIETLLTHQISSFPFSSSSHLQSIGLSERCIYLHFDCFGALETYLFAVVCIWCSFCLCFVFPQL
jgi:hypothetical protein